MGAASAVARTAETERLRVAYVTSRFPFGPGETFLAPEVRALARSTEALVVVPTAPVGGIVHADEALLGATLAEPLLAPRHLAAAAGAGPGLARALRDVAGGPSARIRLKNAAVVPKALWLARVLRERRIDHVHAHWGGTSSTLAMLAAEAARVPWSLTLHRWDIAEDNLLARKLASASFARAIGERSARMVESVVPGARVEVIHVGVETEPPGREVPPRDDPDAPLRLLAVGGLVPVKGHALLLDALAVLRAAGEVVTLDVAGDGPLRRRLEERARALGVAGAVRWLGVVRHPELLRRLRAGEWDALVQPSVERGRLHEGIPVALMEAMSAGLPVVACASGGTEELVGPGAGILVRDANPTRLAAAIDALRADPALARALARGGRGRVLEEFDVERIAAGLVERFAAAAAPVRAGSAR